MMMEQFPAPAQLPPVLVRTRNQGIRLTSRGPVRICRTPLPCPVRAFRDFEGEAHSHCGSAESMVVKEEAARRFDRRVNWLCRGGWR
jgi:hypothetical protein